MRGDGPAEARRYRGSLQKSGKSLAACRVQLQYVDGFGLKHSPEIEEVVAIFAGSDLHLHLERDRGRAEDRKDGPNSQALQTK